MLAPGFNNFFQVDFEDSVQIGLDTANIFVGVLKFNLDPQFGQGILEAGPDVLTDNETFLAAYKGLFVTTDGVEDGAIINIDYSSDATTMVMYYHKEEEKFSYEFFITQTGSAHFNSYTHDYLNSGSSEFLAIFMDSTLGNFQYYLQTGVGFSADIDIASVLELHDSILILPINKAELIMAVDTEKTQGYAPPERLIISWLNENGVKLSIRDQALNDDIDGFYNEERKEYRFIMTSHVQAILDGTVPTTTFRIETIRPATSANRVVLNGNLADTTGGVNTLKLRLYYSQLID